MHLQEKFESEFVTRMISSKMFKKDACWKPLYMMR